MGRSGVVGAPQAVTELAEDCRARAAGRCVSVLDPEAYTPTAMSRHLTSPAVIDADMALNLGLAGLAGEGDRDAGGQAVAASQGLDTGQAEAVGAMGGDRRLEVVIGPAGTGKTRMLGLARQRLGAQGREMVVVAPTRKGAEVAGAEVGADGSSLSKLVYEHGFRWDHLGRWGRLQLGEVDPVTGRTYQGPAEAARLAAAASVVVVDEAGLMTVDQANALIDVVARRGRRCAWWAIPASWAPWAGAGSWRRRPAGPAGPVTLDRVHRFLAVTLDEGGLPVTETDVEYAELSLLLREGDPTVAAERLLERGAVVVHASEAEAVAAIAAEVAPDFERDGAVAVTVATNEDADRVNQAVRELRVQSRQRRRQPRGRGHGRGPDRGRRPGRDPAQRYRRRGGQPGGLDGRDGQRRGDGAGPAGGPPGPPGAGPMWREPSSSATPPPTTATRASPPTAR